MEVYIPQMFPLITHATVLDKMKIAILKKQFSDDL